MKSDLLLKLTERIEWIAEYTALRPTATDLQAEVNKFMNSFDREKRLKRRKPKLSKMFKTNGFVLVQRASRRNVNRAGDITATATTAASVNQKDVKAPMNFYTFQEKAEKLKGDHYTSWLRFANILFCFCC